MDRTKNKIKKPIVIITFIVMSYLSAVQKLKEIFHINDALEKTFDQEGLAGDYATYAYLLALIIGSFFTVLLIKIFWNILIPRITNWRKIDYREAMGILTMFLLITYI